MTESVAGGWFGDAGLANSILELALQGGLVKVVARNAPGSRMRAEGG